MAAPVIIAIGGALLKIASKQLPKYLDKGAKLVKKPTKSQIEEAVPAHKSPKRISTLTKKQIDDAKSYDYMRGNFMGGRRGKSPRERMARGQGHKRESAKELNPDKDLRFESEYEDIPFASGGSIKKNYAYGGRVAKMSAEKS